MMAALLLFIMSSYTRFKYNNRTQNTGKNEKEINNNSKKIKHIRMHVKTTAIQLSQT